MAFTRRTLDLPRGFLLIGTMNDRQFLHDVTGNRRWWPVMVGPVNEDALRRGWSQIVMEAMYMFATEFGGDAARVRLDRQWFAAATEAQRAFIAVDEFAADIEVLLRAKKPDGTWSLARVQVGGSWRVSDDDLRNRQKSGSWIRLGLLALGRATTRVLQTLGWARMKSNNPHQRIQPDGWGAP